MSRDGRDFSTRPVTLVTGGGRGIGAAVCERLAHDGHDLVIAVRHDLETAASLADRLRAEHGVRCLLVAADVAQPEEIERLFEAAAGVGPITGLLANAGLTGHLGPLATTPVEVIRRVLDVNLLGVVLCARATASVLSTAYGGVGGAMVFVSSSAATLGSPGEYVHNAAAKAGIDALTVGLARELAGEGVRVNAVAPGLVRTGIHADAREPGRVDRVAARIPIGRAGEPAEIAPAVAWLLGPDAAYITGAVVRVAGGLRRPRDIRPFHLRGRPELDREIAADPQLIHRLRAEGDTQALDTGREALGMATTTSSTEGPNDAEQGLGPLAGH